MSLPKEVWEKGYVQVYTGDGKGKTTAALGMAIRALGHNLPTLIIQFIKGDNATGEYSVFSRMPP